mgnify:CR=1 FL=1
MNTDTHFALSQKDIPTHWYNVAADFPDMPIVLAHPSFPWQEEALSVATHSPRRWLGPDERVRRDGRERRGSGGHHREYSIRSICPSRHMSGPD